MASALADPPGPDLSPLAGLRAFGRDPIGTLSHAASYGDVAYLRLPRFPVFLLNHPDLVRDVLITRSHGFMKGPTIQASKVLLGESLLTSEGERHRNQRRLIQPMFHHERLAGYGQTMVELAERASGRWRDGRTLDVHREMARLTLSIVSRTLFGRDIEDADAAAVARAMTEVLAQFNRVFSPLLPITQRLPLPSTMRLARARALFDRTIYGMIAERRTEGARGHDLLSLLLRAREEGAGMTDRQVRDEAITLFLAGHETTANALTWTWYLLSEHPEALAGLHAEIDEVLGGRPPTIRDIPRLPYTQMVLSESLRMFPPAWAIGRRALADHPARDHVVPKGAVVVVSPYLVHHDARWFPEPFAFRPARWSDEEKTTRTRQAYFPFGAGPRSCIGESFARTEAHLLIATIARRWRMWHVPDHPVELQPVITLRPRHGMAMTLEERG